ncbi:O-antigen ligase family protein [Lysobacter gummosus]|uniref:O-antigen ligase family protein n=1 Tax=Lysobacter gummosus TaxID=262324 RepID=A0ABY3XCK8_9GAMM|nr:O-antigen ligase family protein [Lysobacter gummosus]ALN93867.1 O-Antigen ligase family protein [Lysobacter gummosus]UNP29319.1 O-antigen ligase family protein [Lysobacter gummosus]
MTESQAAMSASGRAQGAAVAFGEPSRRQRWSRRTLEIGLFCLPALLISTPWGLGPFAALAIVAFALSPGLIVQGWREVGRELRWLIAMAAVAAAVVLYSKLHFDVRWREADNRLRLLTLPFFALMIYAYRPSRRWLWAGALVGLAGAFGVALFQVGTGLDRALGWTANAIVFADALIALIVVAVFTRPSGELLWTTLACALGVAAVALSGSRGVWPGLAIVLVVGLIVSGGRARKLSWTVLAVLALGLTISWWVGGPVAQQMRMQELVSDVDRVKRGNDHESSLGARMTLLELARDTFVEHPLTGVGIGSFEKVVLATPQCAPPAPRIGFCKLGHAHSDAFEWAATMGLPGLIAIFGIYLIPLSLFVRRLRAQAVGRSRSTALAGLVLVLVYIACGLTQSMFAHQLIASFYAVMVGVMYGFALRESRENAAWRT